MAPSFPVSRTLADGYTVIEDLAAISFGGALIFDGRMVVALEQCNPLRLPEIDAELRRSGLEPDPADSSLYRSRGVAPSKAVRAIRLSGPTEIMHPSGEPQRVADGWIVQRLDDPSDIFLVPQHEFVSHYVPRAD